MRRLFQPVWMVTLYLLGPLERVGLVPAAVDVEHELHVIADGLAQDAHQIDVLTQSFGSIAGTVGEEPFLIAEAFLLERESALVHGLGLERVSQAARVSLGRRARGPAQQ